MDRDKYFRFQKCNVCGSDAGKPVSGKFNHTCNVLEKSLVPFTNEQIAAEIFKCPDCGHKYLNPILKDEIINHYYTTVESEYYDNQRQKPSDHRPSDTRKFAEFIKANCAGQNVLEIGCGLGFLLKQLNILNFNSFGIEPSAFASDFARKELNLQVTTGMLTIQTFGDKKFDIIILSDVVEHISDINALFSIIQHYISPKGKLVIFTGNSNSLYAEMCSRKWFYLYSWEHISFFNKKSVKKLFENHGFELDIFKPVSHTGSAKRNSIAFLKTIAHICLNKLKLREEKFYSMAFDHFVAVGANRAKDV